MYVLKILRIQSKNKVARVFSAIKYKFFFENYVKLINTNLPSNFLDVSVTLSGS